MTIIDEPEPNFTLTHGDVVCVVLLCIPIVFQLVGLYLYVKSRIVIPALRSDQFPEP